MSLIEKLQKEIDMNPMDLLGKIEEKDLNFSEFAEYGGGVEEGEEFKNDEPVDSKGMTGVPDEDFSGVTNEDR